MKKTILWTEKRFNFEAILDYQVYSITPSFEVKLTERPPFDLDKNLLKAIEILWDEAQKKRGKAFFNGQLLNFISYENDILIGCFCDYKHYIVQLMDPSLKSILNIHPVAVSGISLLENKCLVGRRSQQVTNYPRYYEFVPSGGIDAAFIHDEKVDYIKQTLSELQEETSISKESVRSIVPFTLIYDRVSGTYEIGLEIKLKEGQIQPNGEYTELFWVEFSDVMDLKKKPFVPFSFLLLKEYLKFHGN